MIFLQIMEWCRVGPRGRSTRSMDPEHARALGRGIRMFPTKRISEGMICLTSSFQASSLTGNASFITTSCPEIASSKIIRKPESETATFELPIEWTQSSHKTISGCSHKPSSPSKMWFPVELTLSQAQWTCWNRKSYKHIPKCSGEDHGRETVERRNPYNKFPIVAFPPVNCEFYRVPKFPHLGQRSFDPSTQSNTATERNRKWFNVLIKFSKRELVSTHKSNFARLHKKDRWYWSRLCSKHAWCYLCGVYVLDLSQPI